MNALTILGSGAAEGIPASFCDCRICREARKSGGRDIRMRTAYSLNERVQIDMGPDFFSQEMKYGGNSARLKHVFITHEHSDHFRTYPLGMRNENWFSHGFEKPLHIYGRPTVMARIYDDCGLCAQGELSLDLHVLQPFEPVELSGEDMTFYPLPANHYHIPGEAVFYVIRHGKTWMLIANDTGIPHESVWKWLEDHVSHLDIVVADCTMELLDCRNDHMGGKDALEFHDRLQEMGIITTGTRYVMNHFSHNGGALHAEMGAYFNPYGIEVGYDGMVIEY